MKNFKKLLTLAAVVIVTAAIAVVGTLAYLTDRDSKVNTFVIGDVAIELTEEFEQGTTLVPGVNIEKKPVITNTGKNDAYVWMTFSIPSALDNYVEGTEQGSNENVIHWNPLGATAEGYVTDARVEKAINDGHLPAGTTAADIIANNKTWNVFNSLGDGQNVYQEEINGVKYNTYVLLYNKALTKGETTLTGIYNVFLDATVDIAPNGDWYKVVNGATTKLDWNTNEDGAPAIYVAAYAVQAEGFADAKDAYKAYQTQWGDNGKAETPAVAENADELVKALAEGKDVVLSDDVTLPADDFLKVADGEDVTINLNGNTLSASSATTGSNRNMFTVKGNLTVTGGTIEMGHTAENMGWGNSVSAFSVEGGELTLNNVTVKNVGGSNMAYGIDVNTTLGTTVLNLNNCTIESTYTAVRIFNNHKTQTGTVNLNSGSVSGGTRDIWVHNPSASAVDANGIVNIADGYTYTVTIQDTSYNGRIYQID